MKIINADVKFITPIDGAAILKRLEQCGRVCYKSEAKITDTSAPSSQCLETSTKASQGNKSIRPLPVCISRTAPVSNWVRSPLSLISISTILSVEPLNHRISGEAFFPYIPRIGYGPFHFSAHIAVLIA